MTDIDKWAAGTRLSGILEDEIVEVVLAQKMGENVSLIYRSEGGGIEETVLNQAQVANAILITDKKIPFESQNGEHFLLAAEALRIRFGVQTDPFLAVHGARIEPLPHQISVVYEQMLDQNPLRFLLADDPGAGKTIMAGLLIRELMLRGVVERCLIVPPGSLVEQWQDELENHFSLQFEILTPDSIRQHKEKIFQKFPFMIARLDMLARNDEYKEWLKKEHWDLVIGDESHRMSATAQGKEISETQRYRLGKILSQTSRHFLLMTATPHNGKDTDFKLFLTLLDPERYAGLYRSSEKVPLSAHMYRRMVKEELVRFDGTALFPPRHSYVTHYELSIGEQALYENITRYVREEMNRAQRLDEAQKVNVTFAMIILQRRLASSSAAIFKSLNNRLLRLENQLQEVLEGKPEHSSSPIGMIDWEDMEEEWTASEWEEQTEISSGITAAQTVDELKKEIATIQDLIEQARVLRNSGMDAKWQQLQEVLQEERLFKDGKRQKILIFSEFRDTLFFLEEELKEVLGNPKAVVTIHGQVAREERLRLLEDFRFNPEVVILLANDAVGEGVNLQQCHLMINYDLPWNPNRLEQRFGRIHRIGQKIPCHQWNLIAHQTREGMVFERMLEKLERAREQLQGKVFDVLGKVFENNSLRDLILDSIRSNDSLSQEEIFRKVDNAMDTENIRKIMEKRALAEEHLDTSRLSSMREKMERAKVQRLQPHNLRDYFERALKFLGIKYRTEPDTSISISNLPRSLESFATKPLPRQWQYLEFDRDLMTNHSDHTLLCPGHHLFEAVSRAILHKTDNSMKTGAILAMDHAPSLEPFLVFMVQIDLNDSSTSNACVSSEIYWLVMYEDHRSHLAGTGIFLDCRELSEEEMEEAPKGLEWIHHSELKQLAAEKALQHCQEDLQSRIQKRRQRLEEHGAEIERRLQTELGHLNIRKEEYEEKIRSGKKNFISHFNRIEQDIEGLKIRCFQRQEDLRLQRQIRILSPKVIGTALVLPAELLQSKKPIQQIQADYAARRQIELAAMQAVIEKELALGNVPRDVSSENLGYDIESRTPNGHLRFLEVKGHSPQNEHIYLTRNEALKARNSPENWILALCEVNHGTYSEPAYIQKSDFGTPGDFGRQIILNIRELYRSARANMVSEH